MLTVSYDGDLTTHTIWRSQSTGTHWIFQMLLERRHLSKAPLYVRRTPAIQCILSLTQSHTHATSSSEFLVLDHCMPHIYYFQFLHNETIFMKLLHSRLGLVPQNEVLGITEAGLLQTRRPSYQPNSRFKAMKGVLCHKLDLD